MRSVTNQLDQKQIQSILIDIYNKSQKNHSLGAREVIMEIVEQLGACHHPKFVENSVQPVKAVLLESLK